ncbi:MAG TPA: hypothetical protein DD490_12880 [Acidobacteria bacterium]|nr:hypothetical protein [Acidobacteriota bacterium]
MGQQDPRVDAYIDQAGELFRPILHHLRAVVHAGCPEVEETIKWGFPHFVYKGIFCSMAAFKGHCAFGFWKASLLAARHPDLARTEEAMGQLGRITCLADLPDEASLLLYVREAAALKDRSQRRQNVPVNSAARA